LFLLSTTEHELLLGAHSLVHSTAGKIKMNIDKVISHKNYDPDSFQNDISLLHVDEYIVFNDYVRPVCVTEEVVPVGTNCIVAGWGDTLSK